MSCDKRITNNVIRRLRGICENAYGNYIKSDAELSSLKDCADSYNLVFTYLKSDISVYMAFHRKSGIPVAEMSKCLQSEYENIFSIASSVIGWHCFWGDDGILMRPEVNNAFTSKSIDTIVLEDNILSIFSSDGSYYVGLAAERYVEYYMRPAKVCELRNLFSVLGSPMIKVGIGQISKAKKYKNIMYILLPINKRHEVICK